MAGINRVLRFPAIKGANTLERAGRAILDSIGCLYVEQHVIGGKFVVDALLTDHNIIVQWDGDFWHGNPSIYPNAPYPIQQSNMKRDKSADAYMVKCGYRVLRFWETDVHSSPSTVASAIVRALLNSDKT